MIAVTVVISGLFPVAITLTANRYLPNWFWIGESFHAFIEGVGAFSAIMLTILFLMSRLDNNTAHHLWIACALLGMGILDGFHASVPPSDTSIWLRSTSTLLDGFLFALVLLPVRPLFLKPPEILIWVVLIGASAFDGYSVLFPESLPIMAINSDFTFTAKILKFIGGILFLISGAQFVIRYRTTRRIFDPFYTKKQAGFGTGLGYPLCMVWLRSTKVRSPFIANREKGPHSISTYRNLKQGGKNS